MVKMFLTARRRTIHRSQGRRVWGDAMCILATLCLSLLPSGGWAQTKDGFEQPPVVEAKEYLMCDS
jgi:hypothetical protein